MSRIDGCSQGGFETEKASGQSYGSAVLDYEMGGVKEISSGEKSNVTGKGDEGYC